MNKGDLLKNYHGDKADVYENTRRKNPKWAFEEQALCTVLDSVRKDTVSILDAPVGTGRFLRLYGKKIKGAKVFCYDFSGDMLQIARKKPGFFRKNIYQFAILDLINTDIPASVDLSVCYRFLNLIDWDTAQRVLQNIFCASDKFALFSIRLAGSDYEGPHYIEDKIYLHDEDLLKRVVDKSGFEMVRTFHYEDDRAGAYSIILCARKMRIVDSWVNKNKRVVYHAVQSNAHVKIYQSHNSKHADFIASVTSAEGIRHFFPQIQQVRDDFVCVPWVKGDAFNPADWQDALAILRQLHAFPGTLQSEFDYVEDIVLPRFKALRPVMDQELYNEIVRRIRSGVQNMALKLSHPDVAPGNLIRANDAVVVIDNELMCRTRHYMVDIFNMLRNFPKSYRAQICREYWKDNLLADDLHSNGDYYQALWVAREAGSDLIRNKRDSALKLIDIYARGGNILPLDM